MMQAQFVTRDTCINCGGARLETLSSGRFTDEPLLGFLRNDPHGEDPLPHLQEARWTFVRCSDCGQKFHRDILDDEWLGVYYDRWISAEAIEEHARRKGRAGFPSAFDKGVHAVERILLIERLTRELRGSDPVRVLDFGCGGGGFLATGACFGFEAVGVEFSAAREAKRGVEFFPSLEEVEQRHPPGHFYAVVLFEVLEHLARPLEVLRDLRRMVATGGILILETPNCEAVTDIRTFRDYRLIHPLGHINAFTPETQARIAEEAGFGRIAPGVAQCSAEPRRIWRREARRVLTPLLPRYTRQFFVADGDRHAVAARSPAREQRVAEPRHMA